jgi:hypothetical protein
MSFDSEMGGLHVLCQSTDAHKQSSAAWVWASNHLLLELPSP